LIITKDGLSEEAIAKFKFKTICKCMGENPAECRSGSALIKQVLQKLSFVSLFYYRTSLHPR